MASSRGNSSFVADRAVGCLLGALIGDGLGVGPHWYYDLNELRRDFGPWIDGYTTPKPGRYHDGMKAGALSQTGLITAALLRMVSERGAYLDADFTGWLDDELLPKLDGTPKNGPGGYTNQDIRDVHRHRIIEKRPWGECASPVDTAEAAARLPVLAALYADDPAKGAGQMAGHCRMTQDDGLTVSLSVAFGCVLSALIRGEAMDASISDKLMGLVHDGVLPFGSVTAPGNRPPGSDGAAFSPIPGGSFPSPDAVLLPGSCAEAAVDPAIRIEPAWKVCGVYGLPCAIYGPLPAAYYLAARFAGDFAQGVLHAINGGGQNLNRASLTGALIGAQVGLKGIPRRFIDGLEGGAELVELARRVAGSAA